MSKINIKYEVTCDAEQSNQLIKTLLLALEDKYGIRHKYTDTYTCQLEGSGVTGELFIHDDRVEIDARLGFFMIPFKTVIENEIISKLNESFLKSP
ncbi:MAG: polyhydroxyalkanoic acid system family protein [Proteobacteria bacterium]|nr:polyhydroxyalkanoic acid system family protein [Pseudomonadota bacterium]